MEDSKIIALFHERSEQAIAELDRKYGAAVRGTAAHILNDRQDTEECVNDAYLAVWNTVPPQKPAHLVSYVCAIARNLAVNRYHARHAKKRSADYELALDELEECIPSGKSVETELEAKELGEAINRFLAALGREDRILFVRRYWYADSVSELAARTNSSPNRVSVRLFRLREKLRKSLMKEGLLV
ncbi:MAG: sigma-70 family RNA polymerase sigma factor [Oscillospiraceae bacterium]|nr:sigma-70 family RNA polymerase sigma factor [Oscillospiraceae bacterium]